MSLRSQIARGFVVVLLLTLGLSMAPASPVLAAGCADFRAGADLRFCDLSGLDLSGVTLTGADLQGTNLRNTNLNGGRLAGANLAYADLRGATFSGANLRGANLTGATVYSDTLDGANVRGATLAVIVVARPAPPPANPVITISYTNRGTICNVNVQLSGFQPNTAYPARYTVYGEYRPELDDTVTTDGAGNASFPAIGAVASGNTVEVSIGDVSSGTSTVAC
ncbi:MAG: pentapeptide repeat-containing protein [Chloroflexota bacterium]|nr:pentapeptide repeat-containing protein [Chloroflexota bacterium]